MMVFKRKQIVVLSLVLMIVVAGYLQYSYKKSSVSADKDSGKIGEAVFVDGEATGTGDIAENDEGKVSTASKQANDFFAQAKLNKDMTRSKDEDALKEIVDDTTADKATKNKAYDQMMKIVDNSEKEMRIETLIQKDGFEDVLAVFGDDGSLDIYVKAPALTAAQVAQIADISSRQAKIDISNIHIKNIY